MDKCPYCQAETRPGDNFCLNCGNRLLPATPSPQQAQPAIGEATLPAADEWSMPNQGGLGSNRWPDGNASTIASTNVDAPTLRSEPPTSVGQATMEKIEQPARLILRADNGEVLQEYPLEKHEISIGRAPNSDILLSKDKLTSRRHATIRYEDGHYVLRDERSANGTFINGQQLEELVPRILQDGDHIGIGEHELIFHSAEAPIPSVDIESMPTIAVSTSAPGELTYRTNPDEQLTAATSDDFSTKSMNGDNMPIPQPAPLPMQQPPSTPAPVAHSAANTPGHKHAGTAQPPAPEGNVTFQRLTALPQPALPDVAPLMAALTTLDGQVSSLQDQLHGLQEAMRNHDTEIAQTASSLRAAVRRVFERMDNTIADVARSREQLAWAELLQLMEDVMNNPRDIEYVTKLARKARELNKVFQIHQNVLNTLAECNSLLRSLVGEDK